MSDLQFLRFAAVLSLMAAVPVATSAFSEGGPEPFSAQYIGSKRIAFLTARAQATIQLQRHRGHLRYTVETVVRLAFYKRRFQDCSLVAIAEDGLRPVEYRHRDDADSSLNIITSFDWSNRLASTQLGPGNGVARSQPLEGPTWDPLSFQLALMARALQSQAKGVAQYRVIERGSLKVHQVHFNVGSKSDADQQPLFSIVSFKGEDRIELDLQPSKRFEPQRLMIEGVAFSRTGQVVPPAVVADTEWLSCDDGESG